MRTRVSPEKKVDLPPKGQRNADPITNAPGSHPIETGIGAAVAGAAGGLVVGAVGGPVATVVGVAVGAVAGGYAGKGIGEMIDPTTEDTWLRDYFDSRPYVAKGDTYEDFHRAYRYGALAEAKFGDAGIDLMDKQLQSEWEASKENEMPWTKAKGAVKDAYDRTVQIRRARDVHPEVYDEGEDE
jgi:phage tail tape-measure protein